MMLQRSRRVWVAAGAFVLLAGLASPARAGHVAAAGPLAPQTPLIELGVSGSSQTLLLVKSLLYCYTGTLGSLVQDNVGGQYILSNNHVLAKENGNLNYGNANEAIIQPGLLDLGPCTLQSGSSAEPVADLSAFVQILFGKGKSKPQNQVDATVAAVREDQVDSGGLILGIGHVGGTTPATLKMPVQKTGRTTAHTFGTVMAIGVTVDISYDSGTARFTDQIRIRRPCGDAGFSDAGDSGSLIVTVPASGSGPSAVGLLFAGGGSDTFANPIDLVLDKIQQPLSINSPQVTKVTMVTGNDAAENQATLPVYQTIVSSCPTSGGGGPGRPRGTPPGLTVARDVAARHSARIFALPDVVGHGVGADENGDAVIEIYVKTKGRQGAGRHPSDIEGVPVKVIETGPIRAY
jgi:hypothetical protein